MSQAKEPADKSSNGMSTTSPSQTTTSNNSNEKVIASDQEQTLKIEISKYTSLINAMSGRKWLRMTISICAIGVFLFFCIFMVAFAIKKMYPYSDITTNGLGATTLKSEKGEVSYWLFNTASLWANTGITVKEGDIITIRSSGKYHTAIHHLFKNVDENKELDNEWIGSEGYKQDKDKNPRDYDRGQFRIFPGMNNGALVMQVATNLPFDTPLDKSAEKENFYYIGKERQHIYINNPGTLYFAINDIVLNKQTIANMIYYSISHSTDKSNKTVSLSQITDLVEKKDINSLSDYMRKYAPDGGRLKLGFTNDNNLKAECELIYYLNKDYKTAWFDDNVGSLLILIEKETR